MIYIKNPDGNSPLCYKLLNYLIATNNINALTPLLIFNVCLSGYNLNT